MALFKVWTAQHSDRNAQKSPRLGGVGNGIFLASWRNCSMFWTQLLLLNGFGSVLGSLEEPEEASSVNRHCGLQLHSPRFNTQSRRRGAGLRGRSLLGARSASAVALALVYITSLVLVFPPPAPHPRPSSFSFNPASFFPNSSG